VLPGCGTCSSGKIYSHLLTMLIRSLKSKSCPKKIWSGIQPMRTHFASNGGDGAFACPSAREPARACGGAADLPSTAARREPGPATHITIHACRIVRSGCFKRGQATVTILCEGQYVSESVAHPQKFSEINHTSSQEYRESSDPQTTKQNSWRQNEEE
jgi:hypothetical protein